MDKILPGLILAAISALTYVAYKHPDGYGRLHKVGRVIFPTLFVGALIWDISASRAFSALYEMFIDRQAARAIIDGRELLSLYVVLAYMGLMLYLEFLAFLPDILADKEPPKDKG